MKLHIGANGCHMSFGKCYTTGHSPPQSQPEAGTRFTYPGGMKG